MSPIQRFAIPAAALVFCTFASAAVAGEITVLSGMFDGSEPATSAISNGCPSGQHGFREVRFQVDAIGDYRVENLFDAIHRHGAMPVAFRLYDGGFDPADPRQNMMKVVGGGRYRFLPGFHYALVVQQCRYVEGAWAAAFDGPGSVQSGNARDVPNFTHGTFVSNDPTKRVGPYSAQVGPYHQSGPIRVSRSGTYYFSDLYLGGAQVALEVYTAPVDPEDPSANLVARATRGVPLIELHAGIDYYFVTQWIYGETTGEFLYALVPPAPFRINPGLTGAWHNPRTPGQGFFLTVYEQLNQVFLSWFTYAEDPPAGDDYGHRWMTAIGSFASTAANLEIEMTSGGSFDAADPTPEQRVIGNIRLEFDDCKSGQVIYGWNFDDSGIPTASGAIPIQRIANDSVALCESLYSGPGMPGPL